jgi:Coenzyme PQQ synthesis protein D (PqqD)
VAYKIDSKNVSWERVENEVIAIQLETGRYYNLLNTSADIWSLLAEGATIESLSRTFSRLFPGNDSVFVEIESFIQECTKAKLLLVEEEFKTELVDESILTSLQTWVTPQLIEYSDLQDLILVDPIHDVEESGWPNRN